MNSPQRTIVFPAELDSKVVVLAQAEGRSYSGMVAWIVERFLRETEGER